MSIALEARVAELERQLASAVERLDRIEHNELIEKEQAWGEIVPVKRKPGPKPKESNG